MQILNVCFKINNFMLRLIWIYPGRFYVVLANYYRRKYDITTAKQFNETAISLALSTGNTKRYRQALHSLAWIQWHLGDYRAGQLHAYDAQRLSRISADLYREALVLDVAASCCYPLGDVSTGPHCRGYCDVGSWAIQEERQTR